MTDPCNGDPSHADTILCLALRCPLCTVHVDLDTMRGKRTTQSVLTLPLPRIVTRYRTRTCSFLSAFLSSLRCPLLFLYSLFHVLFFSSDDGEWFQLGGFRGRRVVATEFERGWRRFCRPSATRCIVSLLHSFLILRQTCVANLRKP